MPFLTSVIAAAPHIGRAWLFRGLPAGRALLAAVARVVLVIFDIDGSADEIREQPLGRVANEAGRRLSRLNLLDGLQQAAASRHEYIVGRAEILFRATLAGTLRFDSQGILKWEILAHSAEAV